MPRTPAAPLDPEFLLPGVRDARPGSRAGQGSRSRRTGDRTMSAEPRLVAVRRNVFKENDRLARELRERFREAGVRVVSLVSSPGSGKTAFLEKTLTMLRDSYRVAALVGDLATDNDAMRLARSQVPVKQITTGTVCHLEAAMVARAIEE